MVSTWKEPAPCISTANRAAACLILYETSNTIHGGETNYIMATVTLYVSIFNLFTSLLHLLSFANRGE